jgi:26S proteasome regulatory subunit T4
MASSSNTSSDSAPNDPKAQALAAYRKRLLEHRELDAQLKDGKAKKVE